MFAVALTLHPTGLGSDQQDQTVRSREWQVGRIWREHDPSGGLPWRWALYAPISGRVGTFDQAVKEITETWSELVTWAGLKALERQRKTNDKLPLLRRFSPAGAEFS
jgi:hypothetical protein